MYSTYNEGKSLTAERFMKIVKSKIYKRMPANDRQSYLSYLNKLVDQNNNTYQRSVTKNHIDADYSDLTEEIGWTYKAPKFKVGDRDRITKYKNIFSKGSIKNCLRKMFLIDSLLKINPCTSQIKNLNVEKNRNFL